jgi:hypothetical protein
MLCRLHGLSILLVAILACGRDDTASAHPRKGIEDGDSFPPRPAVIAAASTPYKVAPVAGGGTITGTVDFDGTPPVSQVVRPSVDANVCGNSIVARNFTLSGTRVAGAVVWLTDIRSGKAFPLERRVELTNDNCTFDPYIQAMTTSGTVNVSNDDRALHTNKFINVGSGQVVGVAPFNDDGEVVPVDRFKEAMEVEVICEQHPWSHAWIAVLDHPYFAQTAANGTFAIGDVPAGRYHVRAWHPALGVVDDSVTVAAGQAVNIGFRIRQAAPSTPAAPTVNQQRAADSARAAANPPAVPLLPAASSTNPLAPEPPPDTTPTASSTAPTTPPRQR